MQAPALEESVWHAVLRILSDPRRLLRQYEDHIEERKRRVRGDPDREAKDLARRLEKLVRRRAGFLDLAADGDMSRDELREKLSEVDEERAGLEKALLEAQGRGEQLRKPDVDYAHLNSLLTQMNGLDLTLAAADRRRIYEALRLQAHVDEDRTVRITGIFDPGLYLPDLLQNGPEWLSEVPDTKGIVVTLDSTRPCTVRTDNALKVRFSATLGEEPEIELSLS